MKEINVERIASEVKRLCIEAACDLPVDVEKLIVHAAQTEESDFGKYAMEKVCRNVKIARENEAPMCQDTRTCTLQAVFWRTPSTRACPKATSTGTCASQP